MATNIAEIGIQVDSSSVRTATTTLNTMAPAARSTADAANSLTASMNGVANAASGVVAGTSRVAAAVQAQEAAVVRAVHANGIYVDSAGRVRAAGSAFVNVSGNVVNALSLEQAAIGGTVNALENSVKAYARAATASGHYVNAAGRVVDAQGRFVKAAVAAAAQAELLAMANQSVATSANAAAAAQTKLAPAVQQGANDVKIMGLNTANLAAQFQDIGVTAAMGMNPLMIALQQGTQISAVLAQNGATAASALSMIGEAAKSVISPLALGTIGIIAIVAALVQLVPWVKVAQWSLRRMADGLIFVKEALATVTQMVVAFAAVWAVLNFSTIVAGFAALAKMLWAATAATVAFVASFGAIPLLIAAAVVSVIYFRKEIAKALGPDLVSYIKAPFNLIIGIAVGAVTAVVEVFRRIPWGLKVAVNEGARAFMMFGNRVLEIAGEIVKKLPSWLGGNAEGIEFRFAAAEDLIKVQHGASTLGDAITKSFNGALKVDWIGKVGTLAEKGIAATARQLNKWADALGKVDPKYKKLLASVEKEIALAKIEQDAIGQTSLQYQILREQTELLAKAKEQDIKLTPKMVQQLKDLGGQLGIIKDETAKMREAFNFARDIVGGFVRDLRDGLRNGESFLKAFANAAINILTKISDKLIDLALDMALNTQKGGATGGLLGSLVKLLGPVMGAGGGAPDMSVNSNMNGVLQNAKGGVFANNIYKSPQLFAFAKGGALGVMGEAGPEAVMPLKRGSDGSLGVQVNGGGANDNAGPSVMVQVINNAQNTRVTEERSTDGNGTDIRRIIIGTVKEAMANGQMDMPMRARFGNVPTKITRG